MLRVSMRCLETNGGCLISEQPICSSAQSQKQNINSNISNINSISGLITIEICSQAG